MESRAALIPPHFELFPWHRVSHRARGALSHASCILTPLLPQSSLYTTGNQDPIFTSPHLLSASPALPAPRAGCVPFSVPAAPAAHHVSCSILGSQGIHRLPDLLRFSLFLNTRQPLQ